MTGISGSVTVGNHVIMAGQTGTAGHISIGDHVMIAAGSGIHRDVKSGEMVGGAPQLPYKEWLQVEACRSKLPEMRATLNDLLKKVDDLQKK